MVSSSLALLYFLLGFHVGKQGSGPNWGQSPVEWGIYCSFVCAYVCPPSYWLALRMGCLAIRIGCLTLRPDWLTFRLERLSYS